MSPLTQKLLKSIDSDAVISKRKENFAALHATLRQSNKFVLDNSEIVCPMAYPYVSDDTSLRQRLIDQKIFVPTFWPNVLTWCNKDDFEYQLTNKLIPLPIDQRYNIEDMARIIKIVTGQP
jgi:hypothetical protein